MGCLHRRVVTVLSDAAALAGALRAAGQPGLDAAARSLLAALHASSTLEERFGAPVSSRVVLEGIEYLVVDDLVVVLALTPPAGALVPSLGRVLLPHVVLAAPPALGLLPGALRLHTLEVSCLEDLAVVWAHRPRLEFDSSLVLAVLADGQVPHWTSVR